jgi:aspartate racemase
MAASHSRLRVSEAAGDPMKTIGLIGGMSWESTAIYYRLINQEVARRLGGLHSARLLLSSVDFAEIEALQRSGEWSTAGALLAREAETLEQAGAGVVLICTNTMHLVAERVASGLGVPLLHIADPTGAALRAAGLDRVGLLGTRFTMEEPFYREYLGQRYGVEVLTPEPDERAFVHRVIYDELCLGKTLDASRSGYLRVIENLRLRGAAGVILGCTEIALLVGPEDTALPLFDTTALHAVGAVDFALA